MSHKVQKYVCHLTTSGLFMTKSACRVTVKTDPVLELSIEAKEKFTEDLWKLEKLICLC